MIKNKIFGIWKAVIDLKISQVGIIVFLLVLIFGYLDFRIQGDGIYNDGQSEFKALPKGMDFKAVHVYAVALRSGIDKYLAVGCNNYPPFVTIAYLPLSFFPADIAYQFYCIILLLFLFALVYTLLSEKVNAIIQYKYKRTCKAILSLLIVYILFQTYPVNFAFERGNYDIIAVAFAAFALLAMSKRYMIASAGLLAISTQLKIYPAILLVLLFARFGWKGILYFVVFNGLMLSLLGIPGFENFVFTVLKFSANPFLWAGNHSLVSFLSPFNGMVYLKSYISLNIFLLPFLGFFAVAVFRYFQLTKHYRKKNTKVLVKAHFNGMEIGIIGISFCLMALVPSVSHDYKLVIQILPLILLFTRSRLDLISSKNVALILTIVISASIAYLFIPRYMILPFRLIGLSSYVAEMKTPALLIAFFGYLYLALMGNSNVACDIESVENVKEFSDPK